MRSLSTMATFGSIVEKQNNLYGLIARAFDNVKKLGNDKINHHNLDTRLKSIDSYWDRFQEHHEKLVGSLTEEIHKHQYFTTDLYSLCEEAYFESRSNIMVLRDTLMTQSNDHGGSNSSSSLGRALPTISLPKFSGEYHEWPSFHDLFKSMVSLNKEIPPVAKLHYLKSQVTGEAARYIANIPVTSENFSRAWDALTARYENKRVLITTYLDRLFSIKPITQKSSSEIKAMLSTVKEVLGALQSLGAPRRNGISSWSTSSLDVSMQRLSRSGNSSKEPHKSSQRLISWKYSWINGFAPSSPCNPALSSPPEHRRNQI